MAIGTLLRNTELKEKDFRLVSKLVGKFCGINLHSGKKELVRARLAKRVRKGNFKSFSDYLKYVLNDETGRAFSVFINTLCTNLTSFYRENQHFEFLQKEFLPALILRKQKNRDFKIRAWSAGCSSGEEAYSMAITLLDAVKEESSWDVKILATDISTHMLKIARTGIYTKDRVDPVTPQQKQKYFLPNYIEKQKYYLVNKALKDAVVFNYLNLMEPWPFRGPMDFIFCRNVMIYFNKATQQKLIERFWGMLPPGGLLFTGHSESLTSFKHKFKYVQPSIYVKL
ncbi:MAG: protein-glutamate O-methyltransferase [Planctomycetes bacterium]|nr:protein-glutamate O-methyltransferase [Planctomycetota bacterium]